MKKLILTGLGLLAAFSLSAADFTASGKILVGGNAAQKTWDSSFSESNLLYNRLHF